MKLTDSELIGEFQEISKQLDSRNDKMERMTKLSRDITISSKRSISLIQKALVQTTSADRIGCLEKAKQALYRIRSDFFHTLAAELLNESCSYFNRAYTFGLQEFIEAIAFLHFQYNKTLISYDFLVDLLNVSDIIPSKTETFNKRRPRGYSDDNKNMNTVGTADVANEEEAIETSIIAKKHGGLRIALTQQDYMLGLLDFTGEVMRSAINSRPDEDQAYISEACAMLRFFHQGCVSMDVFMRRDMSRKIPVLFQSLMKVENFVYQVKIRDSFGKGTDISLMNLELGKSPPQDENEFFD